MAAKRKITINRKKKEPEVEVKEVTLEEALEEMSEEKVIHEAVKEEEQIMFSRRQLKGEIVGNGERTVMQRPRGRIKFEAQVAAVPMFKLPEEIRRYLESHGLPTTVWQWDKEKLEKRNVDKVIVEKLKAFLSGNY